MRFSAFVPSLGTFQLLAFGIYVAAAGFGLTDLAVKGFVFAYFLACGFRVCCLLASIIPDSLIAVLWNIVIKVLPAYKTKSKDPADGVDGYLWSCQSCNAVKKWQLGTMKLVKTFIDPTCGLPSNPKAATIYCPDCPKTSRLYCTACAGCSHRIGTKTQHHSLEAIDPTRSRNLCFLAPLFDFLFADHPLRRNSYMGPSWSLQ
jgi:hypothetical protein